MVSGKALINQRTTDRSLAFAQDNISKVLTPIGKNPLVNGVIATRLVNGRRVSSFDLVGGDNTINHGLDRELQGYLIILKSANVDIYDKQATNTNKNQTLILNAASAVTVSLYVF